MNSPFKEVNSECHGVSMKHSDREPAWHLGIALHPSGRFAAQCELEVQRRTPGRGLGGCAEASGEADRVRHLGDGVAWDDSKIPQATRRTRWRCFEVESCRKLMEAVPRVWILGGSVWGVRE